jgi:hypothetical protein
LKAVPQEVMKELTNSIKNNFCTTLQKKPGKTLLMEWTLINFPYPKNKKYHPRGI